MGGFVLEAQCNFCVCSGGVCYSVQSNKVKSFIAGNTRLIKKIGPFSCCQPQKICYPVGYPITVTYEILLDEVLPLDLFSELILQDPLFSKQEKMQGAYIEWIEVWINGWQCEVFYLREGQLVLPINELASFIKGRGKIIIRTAVTFCKPRRHAKALGRPECCLLLSEDRQPDLVIPDETIGEGKIIKGDLRFIKSKESVSSLCDCERKSIYHITIENMSECHYAYLLRCEEIDRVSQKEKITKICGYEGIVIIKDQYVVCEDQIKIRPRQKLCIYYETIKCLDNNCII